MAHLRNLQVLELSGLRLDQPLLNCGELNDSEARLASEARFHAVERAVQTAIDRHVDLVVLHSEILSEHSAGGRAPWFLGRLIETCERSGIPVVWAERKHNAWMERFVPSPTNLTRLLPGEVHRLATSHGPVRLVTGRAAIETSAAWRDDTLTTIALDFAAGTRLDLDSCDLVLRERTHTSDQLDDLVAAAVEGASHPLATLHTVRADRAHSAESLAVSPLGVSRVSCSLSAHLVAESLAEHLTEEVDSAAGRYFADHPQTQLLVVDLAVTGQGAVWSSLWDAEHRQLLQSEITKQSRHPGCCVRSIIPLADGLETTRACAFTPVLNAIWTEATDRPVREVRSLADIAPSTVTLGDWSRDERIPVDHHLATEVRHACLHLLRSAS